MTLKERLKHGFERKRGQWVASGDIQRAVSNKTSYTAQNVGRRLRELQNEGFVEVQYREKNHAYYRLKEKKPCAICARGEFCI